MKREIRKLLPRALACGFVLAALGSFLPFGVASAQLPQNVLRLHVVANSDSPADQAVKLKVRDAGLEEAARWYGDAATMEEANFALCTHLESITQAANEALLENGSPHTARAQVTDLYFPTRDYEGFSLPAGTYRSLQVTIGAGEGKNWWCVVFPALCLPAAQDREDVLALLPQQEQDIVSHPAEYQVEFKLVELFEELRHWLSAS